ncbi:MAG: UDP-N-acetylmuramoyl-tripeptide--D-alanyl-D-alanine ligase [Clostridiales bacterium]|nr:UDP-N-acetylmuramoyl-tripeptide--D-alanyl-D-alanine ligase [Clostridiales bacterium]
MKTITVENIVKAVDGALLTGGAAGTVSSVAVDSRKVTQGTLFVALPGERADGHDFLKAAMDAGCTAALVSKKPEGVLAEALQKGIALIRVANTEQALMDLAAWYLTQFDLIKVGVTGSVGKTSTKEMVYRILSRRYKTIRNLGNFNNNIGLPLTAFNVEEDTEAAVFEMGMDRLGEIHGLAKIVRPDAGIITTVGISHLERLGSRENIRKAKLEIVDFMDAGCTLIVNGDNDMLASAEYTGPYHVMDIGLEGETLRLSNIVDRGMEGVDFTLSSSEESWNFHVPLPGAHNAHNAALAIAAGLCFEISPEEAAAGLAALTETEKRLRVLEYKTRTVIDDTYNASPESMKAGIDTLMALPRQEDRHPGRYV